VTAAPSVRCLLPFAAIRTISLRLSVSPTPCFLPLRVAVGVIAANPRRRVGVVAHTSVIRRGAEGRCGDVDSPRAAQCTPARQHGCTEPQRRRYAWSVANPPFPHRF
jgi:hypothetical protein